MHASKITCTIFEPLHVFFLLYPVNYKSNNYYIYHKFFASLYTFQNIFIYNYHFYVSEFVILLKLTLPHGKPIQFQFTTIHTTTITAVDGLGGADALDLATGRK